MFTLYNEFVSDPSLDPRTCLTEQRAEWLAHFPPDKMRAWTDCAKASFAPATGDWQFEMLDLADGRRVAEWHRGDVWGRLRNFVPGYPETFVSRSWISGSASIRKATALKLFGSWPSIRISFGSDWGSCRLPCVRASSSRLRTPYLLKALPDRPGAGSGRLRARTGGDGSTEIELQDGRWVGFFLPDAKLCPETVTVQWRPPAGTAQACGHHFWGQPAASRRITARRATIDLEIVVHRFTCKIGYLTEKVQASIEGVEPV